MTPRSSAGPSQVSNTTPLAAAAAGGGYGHPPVDPRHGYADPRYGGAQQPASVSAQYPAELSSQYPQHPQQYSGYASSAGGWSGNAGATSQVQSGAMHGMSIHHIPPPLLPAHAIRHPPSAADGINMLIALSCSLFSKVGPCSSNNSIKPYPKSPRPKSHTIRGAYYCGLSLFSATKTRFLPPCDRQQTRPGLSTTAVPHRTAVLERRYLLPGAPTNG